MAKILLAIVLVLIAASALPDLARWRDFSWLRRWVEAWKKDVSRNRSGVPLIVIPLIVIVVCALIQGGLHGRLFELAAFAFAVVVFYYSWGPRELETDIESVFKAPDRERRIAAVQSLRPDPVEAPLPFSAAAIVEATFLSALSRWFGVLFWFVLLGPVGALGYRVLQVLGRSKAFRDELPEDDQTLFARIALILDWAPAHLLALSLALVSNFDAVIRVWRSYHTASGKGYFTLDLGFLRELARASVAADMAADEVDDRADPLVELADARTLLRRVLVTWLTVVGLLVLAGWVH
ncbi:MAG: regulatory signaling modulator protein AmpE [Dokdonella sp.]